ncbi:MAG: methylamine utilization protein [Gammaproteobacteria bacterium]|nr:methylamine utilization protein [Gammaproteobacteria bacterium]
MQTTSGTSRCSSATDVFVRATLFVSALGMAPCAIAAELHASVHTVTREAVADAVVIVTRMDGNAPAGNPAPDTVDQVDKQFVPYVRPIHVGSEVTFPNSDNIRHQVYSFSPAKRFELPLYRENPGPPVLFDKPGVVALGCNIHDWMIGYIYVSESPWFAKTAEGGAATIADLPEGNYRARIWHPQMDGTEESTVREFAVSGAGNVEVDWELTLKPELRPRRAPLGREPGYR